MDRIFSALCCKSHRLSQPLNGRQGLNMRRVLFRVQILHTRLTLWFTPSAEGDLGQLSFLSGQNASALGTADRSPLVADLMIKTVKSDRPFQTFS